MVIVPLVTAHKSCLMFPRCAAVHRTVQPPLPGDGSQPSNEELTIARYQGEYVAGLAKKLNG
jgi:hypothetical protein